MAISKKTGWVDSRGKFHDTQEAARESEFRLKIEKLVKGRYNFENSHEEEGVIEMLCDYSSDFYEIYSERFAPYSKNDQTDNNGDQT